MVKRELPGLWSGLVKATEYVKFVGSKQKKYAHRDGYQLKIGYIFLLRKIFSEKDRLSVADLLDAPKK